MDSRFRGNDREFYSLSFPRKRESSLLPSAVIQDVKSYGHTPNWVDEKKEIPIRLNYSFLKIVGSYDSVSFPFSLEGFSQMTS
jgi:hypothetical protein